MASMSTTETASMSTGTADQDQDDRDNNNTCLLQFEQLTEVEIAELCLPFEELVESTSENTIQTAQSVVRDAKLNPGTSVDDFISSQAKRNTTQATVRDMKNVQRWLYDNKREPRVIENIPPPHLNSFLAELYIGIRKADGSNYEPTSLEALKNSIERYLKEKNYPASLRDRAFSQSMRALTAKKMELKKLGLGNKPNKSMNVSNDEEEKMYSTGALGTNSPKSLQFTVFYNFGKMFGLRGRDEARQLKFGDVTVKTTSRGEKYLEFSERVTKTRDGANLSNTRDTTPKIFATKGARDPVKVYDTFAERRPESMMSTDSPFYLTPIPEQRLKGTSEEPWYYPRPMGEATLGGLMKNAAQQAGISARLTNHSIRKSTVTTLSKAGVPPHKIMKITGHKNIQSIAHYDAELSEGEHQHISELLQPGNMQHATPMQISTPTPPTAQPLQEVQNVVDNYNDHSKNVSNSSAVRPNFANQSPFPFMAGNTFHNCTFNLANSSPFGNFQLVRMI